jgi:hypothetical protein
MVFSVNLTWHPLLGWAPLLEALQQIHWWEKTAKRHKIHGMVDHHCAYTCTPLGCLQQTIHDTLLQEWASWSS